MGTKVIVSVSYPTEPHSAVQRSAALEQLVTTNTLEVP